MNCNNCGNPLNGNERFCEKCGNPIEVNQNMSFGGVNPSNPVNSFGANMNQNTVENSVLQNTQPNFVQPAVASNDQFSTLNNQSNSFGGNVSNPNMNNDVNSNQGVMNGSTYNQQPQVGQSQTNMYGQSMNTNQMGYGQSMNNQMSQTGMYGQPMNSPTTQPQYGQMPGMNQQPEKKNVGLIIVLVILIIAVLGAGGFAIYHFTQSDDTEEKEENNDKEDKDDKDDKDDDDDNDDNDDNNDDDDNNSNNGNNGGSGEKVEFLNEEFVIPSNYTYELAGSKLAITTNSWYGQIAEFPSLTYEQLVSVKEQFIAQLDQTSTIDVVDYYTKRIAGHDCFIIEGKMSSANVTFILTKLNSSTTIQITMMSLTNSNLNSTQYEEAVEILP